MQKRQILINSIMSVLQIVVISGVLFFLYKFLLNSIGAEKFGIWSLVLAATAVTQIADLGLSGSVVKFVAKYIARGEKETVSGVIQTAVQTIGLTVGLVLILGFPLIRWGLRFIMPSDSLPFAVVILPYAFLALWGCVVTSVLQSGLDGYQRFDLRSLILMAGAIFHLLLCFWLVPKFGLLGLAYAKVVQNFSVLIVSWWALKKILPSLPLFPFKWNKTLFKEMIGYSLNFQAITVATMLYDPITKALLSKFGSLSMVGYYQMASKMIQKLHALVIAANQVLVPAFADLKEKTPERIQDFYSTSYRLLFYLIFPLYFLVIISLPLISEIWIGYYEKVFVVAAALLAAGWLLNTLASPAYHANLGIGKLRWNVVGHITIALLNVGLGILLGVLYGTFGVIVAWMLSLTLGSSIIYVSYHLTYHLPFGDLVPRESRWNVTACLIGLLSSFLILQIGRQVLNITLLNLAALVVFAGVIFSPYWRHPMRKRLIGWVREELLK
jgi:O-antigen/teichoic acid export membrane protein